MSVEASMLNIGAGEIALIVIVALLVLGPTRLPELARGIGKFMREFRRQTDDVRHVIEREFYKLDDEIQSLPPPPGAMPAGAARPAALPTAAQAPPAPASGVASWSAAEPLPAAAALHLPPERLPAPEPLDPSFARTDAHPVVAPAPTDAAKKAQDDA